MKVDCWKREKKANYAEEAKEPKEESLFMAHHGDTSAESGVWFLDSGCSKTT